MIVANSNSIGFEDFQIFFGEFLQIVEVKIAAVFRVFRPGGEQRVLIRRDDAVGLPVKIATGGRELPIARGLNKTGLDGVLLDITTEAEKVIFFLDDNAFVTALP